MVSDGPDEPVGGLIAPCVEDNTTVASAHRLPALCCQKSVGLHAVFCFVFVFYFLVLLATARYSDNMWCAALDRCSDHMYWVDITRKHAVGNYYQQ